MKYWVKVRGNDEKLIGKIYNEQNLITNRSHTLWVNKIRQMLNNTGLSYRLEKNNLSNLDFLLIQRRLRDNFIQEWHSSIIIVQNWSITACSKTISSTNHI